ncbi:unnamed protein product [Tenebrio molitor]|nr:unnamed protein product [Tenebrio molitor]
MVRIESVVRADTLFVMVPEKNPKIIKNSSTTLQPCRNYFKSSKDFSTKIRGDPNMIGIGFVVRADILLATIPKKNSKNICFQKQCQKS